MTELTRNKMSVCMNPCQGPFKRVLTVCSAGCLRSPSAANVLHAKYSYNTRSCGLDTAWAIVPFSETLAFWADEIVVMESWQAQEIQHSLDVMGLDRPVICLNIPDCHDYMSKELVEAIVSSYEAAKASSLVPPHNA